MKRRILGTKIGAFLLIILMRALERAYNRMPEDEMLKYSQVSVMSAGRKLVFDHPWNYHATQFDIK
jgi:hypothetical protein